VVLADVPCEHIFPRSSQTGRPKFRTLRGDVQGVRTALAITGQVRTLLGPTSRLHTVPAHAPVWGGRITYESTPRQRPCNCYSQISFIGTVVIWFGSEGLSQAVRDPVLVD